MKIKRICIFLVGVLFITSCATKPKVEDKKTEETELNQTEENNNQETEETDSKQNIDEELSEEKSEEDLLKEDLLKEDLLKEDLLKEEKSDEDISDEEKELSESDYFDQVYVDDDGVEFLDEEEPFGMGSEEELFLEQLNNISLTLVSSPKETKKNKAFAAPYVVSVVDSENNPVSMFEVKLSYPIARINDDYTYDFVTLTTDDNGKVYYTPEYVKFAADTKIYFEPNLVVSESDEILSKIEELKISADYKVKSTINSAVLFVWDYNELNKPTGNSYELISSFRKRNVWNVGNAPVNETSDIGKSSEYLYQQNYEIIENSFDYLIGGTIKFTKRVEKVDDGYEASLIAEIYAIDMNNGKEIYRTIITNSAVGANWNKAVEKSRTELAEKIVNALFYSL